MAVPIYQEYGRTYTADTCLPVVRAVAAGQLRHHALSHGHYPGRRLARSDLPGVKSVGFWDADCQQNWGLDWHRNEGIELTFLESGRHGFAVEHHETELHAGDMTITRPWQKHRVGNPHIGAGRLHFLILDVGVRRPHQTWRWPAWIVLTSDDLRQLTNILRHNEQPVWRATPEVVQAFIQISALVEAHTRHGSVSGLAVQINQLLLSTLEMLKHRKVRLDESLSTAQRTVELFWADLESNPEHLALAWTVRGMARRCGMGATSFIGYTRQLTNMTPIQYLNHCRLTTAAQLLRQQPDVNVTDVALSCGFGSSQYFATLFRRKFGIIPRAFRRQT